MLRARQGFPAGSSWAICLALLAGCGSGDGLERVAVSGNVTLDGRPLETGMIQFNPTSADQPVISGGAIIAGRYDIPRDQGPVPGTYSVSINSAPREARIVNDDELYGPGSVLDAPPDPIPPVYNAKTTLTAEITKGGRNRVDFELKSNP